MAGNEYFCKNENDLFFLYKTRYLSQWLYMAISIDDITDQESLITWLNERPKAVRQNCAVFIAARSALRVMSIAVDGFQFSGWSRDSDFTSTPIWHSLIISSVAAKLPSDDMRKAASAADAAAFASGGAFASDAAAAFAAGAAFSSGDDAAAFAAASAAFASSAAADAASASAFAAAAAAAVWRNVRADCRAWMDRAAVDGTCGIDVAPLIDGEFKISPDWAVVREKLLNDSDPKRGADWLFWVEWYDKILRGDPQDWDMLYEIAVSQDIDWEASPREVNAAIARIVEKYRKPQQAVTAVASIEQVARTKAALTQNKAALPPTLDAIEFLISNEIKRLQEKNYADDIEMEESKRMISVFLQLLQATSSLAEKVPEDQASDEDAEEVISTLNMYKTLFSDWPRDNAPEVVDSVCRIGIVGCVTGVFVMCGLPAGVGAAVAGAAFGGKKLADFAKSMVKGE